MTPLEEWIRYDYIGVFLNGVDVVDRIGDCSGEAYDRFLSIADRVLKSRLS